MKKEPLITQTVLTLVTLTLLQLTGISTINAQTESPKPAQPAASAPMQSKSAQALATLSEGERAQYKSALKIATKDPKYVAASQAVKGATTPEEKKAASTAKTQLQHDLMVAAEPTIEPVLVKYKAALKAAK